MTCRTPSGSQYLAKCQPTKALSLSLQDTTHTHSDTHVYLAQCSALSRSDFETIQKGSHCKMWCLKQLELQLLLRGTEIMIAVVLQHRANKIHFIYTWQPSNLKWNGIFLMKFIAMVHLLFNTFSVPSALPCVMTAEPLECLKFPTLQTALSSPLLGFFINFINCAGEKNASLSFCLSTAIVTAYETNTQHDPNNNNAMLGVHASASAIIQYGKIARKQVLVQADKLTSIKMNKCNL